MRPSAAGRAAAHLALLAGSVAFAFPFVWLVSTSLKYDEEIMVYPPRWLPAVPAAVVRSPWLTAELLDDLPPADSGWDGDRWERLWPALSQRLWAAARPHRPEGRGADHLDPVVLRDTLTRGLAAYAARGVPAAAWADDETVAAALTRRVDADLVTTVWDVVFRAVALRAPSVQSVERDYLPLPPAPEGQRHVDAWQVAAGPAALEPAEDGQRPARLLVYDLSDATAFRLRGDFPLPVPEARFLGFTLPLRQDRSWHRLRVELEVGGRRYASTDDLYLEQYRWQELGFKRADLDSRDERDLGIWPLVPVAAAGAVAAPGRMRLTVDVEGASPWAAAWRKYGHHYRRAQIATEHWWSYVANSVYLVLLSMLGQALSCSLVAYAFARLHWPGRELWFGVLLATMMLPPQVTMIPVFMIFERLGWYNTLRALWAPSFLGSAFFIFLLRQFMKSIPDDLEDAARIDGCSHLGIYWRIVLPLVKPALAAVCIFTFMGTWNDFMGPLIYINDQRLYPLALGLFDFRAEHRTEFGMLMAASTLMTLPVIALFFLAQRYFIQGVTLTGMKG